MSEESILVESERKAVDIVRVVMGVGGLIAFVLGLLIIFNPVESGTIMMTIVAVVLGCYLVIAGFVFLGAMIFSKTMGGWRRFGTALLGLLYLIAGIFVFGHLDSMAAALALFLSIFIGITWIFEGIMAFTAVKDARSKTWTIIYGIVSILAGLVLVLSPLLAVVTLWLILGIAMAVMGLVQIIRAFTTKSVFQQV